MKAAIYARYSSDNQRPESIDDQVRACLEVAVARGLPVDPAHIFSDEPSRALSVVAPPSSDSVTSLPHTRSKPS